MSLIGEPAHIAEERETINKTLAVLKKANKILKRDPDLASYVKHDATEKSKENSLFGSN